MEMLNLFNDLFMALASSEYPHFHQGTATNSVNSKDLWMILQNVIYTEQETRLLRECIDLSMKVVRPSDNYLDYYTGSRGEGFHFGWSDIDIFKSSITNYVSIDKRSMKTICKYIAIDKDCQPGYCKLLFETRSESELTGVEYQYLSREKFSNEILLRSFNSNSDKYIHGPCVSTAHGNQNGFDQCTGLPIHPDSSNAFLKNFLTKFWNNVKSKVINESITVMHCVPKGPENGDEEGNQWLISFCILEQHIVHSLNHVQFCCYGLMKILLHKEIDSCTATHDTLSSYHLKTVLFHVLEDVHSDFWIPQNIFYCIRICLTRLLLYVIKGCCPNYFKPECNLLLKRRILENREKIERKLFEILRFDIMDLFFSAFSCSTILQKLYGNCTGWARREKMRILPELKDSLKKSELFLNPIYLSCNALMKAISTVKAYQTTYMRCIYSILMIMNLLLEEQDEVKVAFLKHMFLSIIKRMGVIMYDKFILTRFNFYLRSAETAFMLASNAGVYEGVYLATLWFCRGKYFHCIRLLRCMDDGSSWSKLFKCLEPPYDFMSFISYFDLDKVELYRANSLFPEYLKNDVQKCVSAEFEMHSRSYRLFLEFLCFYEKGEIDRNIVDQLQQSYTSESFQILDTRTRQNSRRLLQIATDKMRSSNK